MVIALSFRSAPPNRMGDARSLRAHAGDRLRAQVFFFEATVRHLLLLPGLPFWPLSASFNGPFIRRRLFPFARPSWYRRAG